MTPLTTNESLFDKTAKLIPILLIMFFAAPITASANSNCDNPRNDFDGLYCLNKVYLQADKDLNKNYKALVKHLDKRGKKILKKSQIKWIKSRDADCSYHDRRGFFVNLDCASATTIQRAQFLNDRKRECVSSGCMNSRLDD